MSAPRVLHVLPHPGGGGEEYVGYLEGMSGFRFQRLYLTSRRRAAETPGGLARLFRARKDVDLIHVHGDSAALVSSPALGTVPSLITLNGLHLARRTRGIRRAIVRVGLRRVFARVDEVIGVSESEADEAREIAPAAADRVHMIHNAVPEPSQVSEDERSEVRRELGLGPGSVAVLFIGELSERKQPVELARAVQEARTTKPEIVALLAGEGPLRPELESIQDEGIRLLGHRDDTQRLLAAADVFALPSRWEGLSFALLEALAIGRAVLVSDGPGNPDAVGPAGVTCAVGDVTGMGSAIARLAADPELRASLGEAAAARARELFSLPPMLEATARIYGDALRRAGR